MAAKYFVSNLPDCLEEIPAASISRRFPLSLYSIAAVRIQDHLGVKSLYFSFHRRQQRTLKCGSTISDLRWKHHHQHSGSGVDHQA